MTKHSEKIKQLIRKSLPMINFDLELEEPELSLEEGLQKRPEENHAITKVINKTVKAGSV
ncbi:hypothetical protein DU30_09210 [Methanosarcina mazei]|uniref:Uncharacterized protein n=1 Tax=Methanosarcina mazei TaxID=2209 RepID=A0A0F8GLV9_METMZ|nr:hypothetical protein DU30_09210 [Methanosarcina mazei]